MIKSITIGNVKGFGSNQCFQLNIIPNKPSILVAPNGFGKSSLTAAFNSLNANRMLLHKDHYHQDNNTNIPYLAIEYRKTDGSFETLEANDSFNEIGNIFDVFVINSKLEAKASTRKISGRTIAVSSMETAPIILVNTIPEKTRIVYSYSNLCSIFGLNGKILPNITTILKDKIFIKLLSEHYTILDRTNNIGEQTFFNALAGEINSLGYTADKLKVWIYANKLAELRNIQYFTSFAQIILNYPEFNYSEIESYLVAYQISKIYSQDTEKFKKACKYNQYEIEKAGYLDIFSFFNATWKDVKPQEIENSLVLTIPKAKYISNGQRDVLTFIALLQQAKNKFSKNNCILIIDEVFDYLDDANLIAVQYYITQFIDKFKDEGKKFYPLILTHLNPFYFHSYAFSEKNKKVYFLKTSSILTDTNMRKLIEKREEESIKDAVAKYFLHYHNQEINIREKFKNLSLKETWGEINVFNNFVNSEVTKYIQEQSYCPFSVCIALRKKIEEKIYLQLATSTLKNQFINIHGTPNKLDFAENNHIFIQETYYLLGVIYNEVAHLKNYVQNNSPLINKLENMTIKSMIKKVFE